VALTAAPNHSQANSKARTAHATLRSYRLGDWQAMYALDLVCFEPVFQFSRGAMRAFAEAPGAVTVLAEADEQLAGFCIAQLKDRTGYVVTLDVAPAYRRRGLARRLMADVESKLHSAGAAQMELHVFTGNAEAIRFYESIGYAKAGVVQNFYAQNLHAFLYRKQLRKNVSGEKF
jgi:ribosomal-protein-alanine N-acetyltransferase